MEKHSTNGSLFDDIHSNLKIEWEGDGARVPDNETTASAREMWQRSKTHENAMRLAKALCFQLRYRECLTFCESLLELYPSDYALMRRLGVLNFKLLRFDTSKYYLKKCLAKTDERLYILYMLGTASYFACEYESAKQYFAECFPLCEENGEMYVAALFWDICCNMKTSNLGDVSAGLLRNYKRDCGHHTGYDLFVRLAMGELKEADAARLLENDTELNKTCFYYGMSVYFKNNANKSHEYLIKALAFTDWFGGYAYIAAYTDFQRLKGK